MSDNYELRWEVAGTVQLSRTFTRLGAVLRDFRRPLGRLAREVIYPEIKHQFETEGNPAWPPLSPGYARRKALKYPGRPKLVASGALRKSLVNRNATGSIYTLTKEYLEIGTRSTSSGPRGPKCPPAPCSACAPKRKLRPSSSSTSGSASRAAAWVSMPSRSL